MKKNDVSREFKCFALKRLLTAVIFFSLTGMLHANPGIDEDVLNKRISLVVEKQEVRTVLTQISKLAEIKFVYSPQRIPCRKKVSMQVYDKKVGEVLNSMLGPLEVLYYVSGSQIVLMKKGEEEEFIREKIQAEVAGVHAPVFKPITGRVNNDQGQPLEGVSVTVKGTNKGTTTNSQGAFTIDAESGETLVFTMIGYSTNEIKLGNESSVSIQLESAIANIDEVVVIGYGTQNRRSVTGAVSRVSGKTLNELPSISVAQALQGRVPGVQVTNNGSPGSAPIVRIRGISSINFASDPLYVVDGFPTGDLATIDMRDVESVDVLKDASAAAIYGSRATSGVIMITTKKGARREKVQISLNSYYGMSTVTKRLDLLNTQQFMQYALAYRGSQVPRLTAPTINEPIYAGATTTYGQTNTDWQDEYFKDGQMTQTHIGLSGGNDVSRYYASASYLDQRGTTPSTGNRRYNFRINSEHNISKVFTFGQTLYTAFSDQDYDGNEQGSRSNLVNVIRIMPHMPVYDPTTIGGFRGVNSVLDGGDPTNPVEDAKLKNPGNRSRIKILGTSFLEIAFTKSLKFRSTFGVDYANGLDYRFQPIFNDGGTVAGSSSVQATVTNNRAISTVLLFTEQLTYEKTFDKHRVNVIAVVEQQNQKTQNENGRGNQPSNDLRTLNNALNQSIATTVGENSILSFLGRVNYEFDGKYMVSGAIRRDGVSVWAPGNKWGTFPSVSVGWRVDQEPFMQSQKNISELKVRGGYGVTGVNGVLFGNTPWLVSVTSNSSTYPFNNALAGLGSSIQRLGNRDLEWETTKQLNIGIDLGLLRNKITLTAEYFNRKTDNLILNVTVPPSMGFINSSVAQNAGAMTNHGFEFQLGYNQREGAFKWNATGNLAIIRNKVTRLAPGLTSLEAGADQDFGNNSITRTQVGEAIQSFYGWVVEGIFQSAAEVASSPTQLAATSAGDLKFADLNKDGKIDNDDRTFLGSYLPKFTYALNLGANYKNFDASIFVQGVSGNKIYNATRVITEGMIRFFNAGTQVLNAWTPSNTNTNVPRAIASDPNANARTSTRFLEKGSFLRFQNFMIGYNIPDQRLGSLTKGVLSSFRIYVSAQNLFTITDYSGYDPEVGNRTPGNFLTNGIDFAVYPSPKSFQVGIQANF